MVSVHVGAVPLQAPPQPKKILLPLARAVSVTRVPLLNELLHVVPQSMPSGLLVTMPLEPESSSPVMVTVRLKAGTGGVLVLVLVLVLVRVRVLVPVRALALAPGQVQVQVQVPGLVLVQAQGLVQAPVRVQVLIAPALQHGRQVRPRDRRAAQVPPGVPVSW